MRHVVVSGTCGQSNAELHQTLSSFKASFLVKEVSPDLFLILSCNTKTKTTRVFDLLYLLWGSHRTSQNLAIMTSAFRNLRQMVDNLVSGEDNSSDSDYVSTSRGGKRKASNDLRRPSKSRRYFRPQFAEEDYTTSDFWEGAAERRTSRPTLLGAGVDTLVMDSGTESGHATPEPSNHFSIFNRKITPVRRGSSGKPASPERVRQGRLRFWDKLQKLVGGVEKVAEEADEEGIDQVGLNADLEHAKEDLEHARSKVEEAQAEIEHRGFPQQPIEEYQPSPEPENLPTLTLTAPSSRQNSEDSPWTSAPNARARRIIRHTRTLADAATRIKEELTEPEYAYRDIEIRDTMWQIMDKLECFARVYFGQEIARNKKELEKVFREMEPETVKVIGCVASGGPGGENGWRELFWDERKRGALVCAIIGNVLVEQVFQHACFGADEELLKELREIQEEMQDEDGKLFIPLFSSYAACTNWHEASRVILHTQPISAARSSPKIDSTSHPTSPFTSQSSSPPSRPT